MDVDNIEGELRNVVFVSETQHDGDAKALTASNRGDGPHDALREIAWIDASEGDQDIRRTAGRIGSGVLTMNSGRGQ